MSAQSTRDITASRQRRALSPEYDCVSPSEARRRQASIGARLREEFARVLQEPAPEDFLAILRRADARSREH
jgi:hypothetical protein